MPQGFAQALAGHARLVLQDVCERALRDDFTTEATCAGPEVQDRIRTPHRLIVMFDHEQRVTLVAQSDQRVEQGLVVTGMEADGRFIEHIQDAAQVAAKLSRQANALRLATAERIGTAVELQIAKSDLLHEVQSLLDLVRDVASNDRLGSRELEALHHARSIDGAQLCEVLNTMLTQLHRATDLIDAAAFARGALSTRNVIILAVEFALLFHLGFEHRHIIAPLLGARLAADQSKATAGLAPAMRTVEGEQARIEFLERPAARRAAHLRVQHQHCLVGELQLDRALAHLQRLLDHGPQLHGCSSLLHVCNHRIDRVLLEAFELLEVQRAHQLAIHQQGLDALLARVLRHIGVEAFARLDQRREHMQRALLRLLRRRAENGGHALLAHRDLAVRAVLRAKLREQQTQEVIHLRHRRHRGLATAARDALLNRHRGWHACDEVHVRLLHLLHKRPRIDRHRIEEAPLTFSKDEIKRERRFSTTTQARDDHELIARDLQRDVLEVVLTRSTNGDGVRGGNLRVIRFQC